jgi:hypothetical protein
MFPCGGGVEETAAVDDGGARISEAAKLARQCKGAKDLVSVWRKTFEVASEGGN